MGSRETSSRSRWWLSWWSLLWVVLAASGSGLAGAGGVDTAAVPGSLATSPAASTTYDVAPYAYGSMVTLSATNSASGSGREPPSGANVLSRGQSVRSSASAVAAETAGEAASAARGGVYSLRDGAGNVVRTGRSNNLAAREVAHANDPVLGDFTFRAEYRTDVYAEQRGLEQALYDANPGAMSINGGFNKIRGISLSNPRIGEYTQAAEGFFARLGG